MSQYLVVVESPTKIKSLKKVLGQKYNILASKGHVIDLPAKSLGVDVDNEFEPSYVTIPGKESVIKEIRSAAKKADTIYLAPDPDREGEAIAWHLASEIRKDNPDIKRVLIQEITAKGIEKAISNPLELDQNKFESQQARRILDRLVGYKISPFLWKKVRKGLSAGRVQSVALRVICEREEEIRQFRAEEYWTIDTNLSAKLPPPFVARLYSVDGEKIKVTNQPQAESIKHRIESSPVKVLKIQRRERKRNPVPPFTTSKIQQEAFRKLGFNTKRTMSVAQKLYEGIDVTGDGPVGLITYMRTDSTRLSEDSIQMVRSHIKSRYGDAYLPKEAIQYKTSKSAQDAHEAIRPTSLDLSPEKVASKLSKEQLDLYQLIWNRFVACQMSPAVYDQMILDIGADKDKIMLRAAGSRVKFKGFLEAYEEGRDETRKRLDDQGEESQDDQEKNQDNIFPDLVENEILKLNQVLAEQHFTQPPPRFNESSIVKELDEKGIGRPSTYSTIISTIIDREYVKREENRLHPTALGEKVNQLLVQAFPDIVNVGFTAHMEESLDKVEEGKTKWRDLLKEFYLPFSKQMENAESVIKHVKAATTPTDILCDKCGEGHFLVRWSSGGEFLGCSSYPKCRNARQFTRDEQGHIKMVEPKYTGEPCPTCGKRMVEKDGRYGAYVACENYPSCPTVKSPTSDVQCPEKECSGNLIPRRTKSGKNFWGCTNYPDCTYASWNKPIKEVCPQCQFPVLTERFTKKDGMTHQCPSCKAISIPNPK